MIDRITRILDIYLTRQFLLFLAVGGAAAFIHWLARFGFNAVFGYLFSVVLAYGVGLFSAFVLNRIFVFPRSGRPISEEVALFTIVNLAAFPFVVGVSYVCSELLFAPFMPTEWARAVGHGIGVLSPVLVNFAAHKFWTFKES